LTVEDAQAFLSECGGYSERRAPVHSIVYYDDESDKIISALDENGELLANLGYRPWNPDLAPHYLFVC